MWFNPDTIARAIQNAQTTNVDTEEMKARREAEKKIEESGRATCANCGDEIWKNMNVPGGGWVWESEAMVGYCEKGSQGKHKPLIKYDPEQGVVTA